MDEKIVILLQKYRANTLTKEEYTQLQHWVQQSEENSQYLATFIQLYKIQHMQGAYKSVDPLKAYDNILMRSRRRTNIKRIRYTVAAACILALISTIVLLTGRFGTQNREQNLGFQRLEQPVIFTSTDGQTKSLENGGELVSPNSTDTAAIYHTVQTQKGGNFKLILPDQSIVWMNANTTVRYAANFLKDRTLVLDGEAFFEVQKNGTPFFVKTDKNTVRVLGTRFNVSAYPTYPVMTTLVKGSVEVANASDRQILVPDQQAIASSSTSVFELKKVNTAIYTSWVDGVFEFQHAQLEDIMEQLTHWYDIEVVYQSPALQKVHFTGSLFRDNSLLYSLQIIQEISDVKFRNENGQLYVYK